jgi:hypothetical protein
MVRLSREKENVCRDVRDSKVVLLAEWARTRTPDMDTRTGAVKLPTERGNGFGQISLNFQFSTSTQTVILLNGRTRNDYFYRSLSTESLN